MRKLIIVLFVCLATLLSKDVLAYSACNPYSPVVPCTNNSNIDVDTVMGNDKSIFFYKAEAYNHSVIPDPPKDSLDKLVIKSGYSQTNGQSYLYGPNWRSFGQFSSASLVHNTHFFWYGVGTPQLILDLVPQTGGTVTSSPGTLSCESGICRGNFFGNVTLTAVPEEGWTFSHWVDGGTNYSDNPRTVFMGSTKTMKAVFRLLSLPLAGYTPYTVPTSSVFDHAATAQYNADTDNRVETFNGEASIAQNPKPGTTCYPKADSSAFGSGFNYVGYGQDPYYLCYGGHPGYDYAVNLADVQSAASGTVRTAAFDSCLGNHVIIDHPGGYATKYFHLYSIDTANVQEGYPISSGIKIGVSGNTGSSNCTNGAHLHFQVEKNGVPVDPYGWTGSGADPYTAATNDVLWK